MKKNNRIILCIILSLIFVSCSQEDEGNNGQFKLVKKVNLPETSGTIESNETYIYNDDNLIVSKQDVTGNITQTSNYIYDTDGKLISINKDTNGNPGTSTQYNYDSEGNLINYLSSNGYNDVTLNYTNNIVNLSGKINGMFGATIELVLNNNKQVIRAEFYSNGLYKEFTYNTEGNLVKINHYNNGNLINETNISYDNKQNPFISQFDSIYIAKFISYFFPDDRIFISSFTRNFGFPYLKNNVIAINSNGIITTASSTSDLMYDSDNFITNVRVNFVQGSYTSEKSYNIEYYE